MLIPFAEDCRERIGVNITDKRMNIQFVRDEFPFIDFGAIATDEDMLWKADTRETYEEISLRALVFAEYIASRPEKIIMVVAHSVFLSALLNVVLDCNECGPDAASYVHPGT